MDESEELWNDKLIEEVDEEVQNKLQNSEKFLEIFGLPPDTWEDWSGEDKKVVIDKAVAKEITRRFSLMRILKFLCEKYPEPLFTKEISQGLKMSRQNLIHNLKKLVKAGVVERVFPSTIDLRTKYYRIVDKELAEKLIRRYHYLASFRFAKLIPKDETVYLDDLKKNCEFQRLCEKYYLKDYEAIRCLENNSRIKPVYIDKREGYVSYKQLIGFKRKEQ